MKQIIPINTVGGVSKCITAHYSKTGWKELISDVIPVTATLEINGVFSPNTEIEMEEPKIMQIGSYSPSSACNGKVLDADGICPTLLDHKGAEPAVLTPIRTDKQRQLCKQGIDTFGGRQMLPRTDGVSNTITTVQKDNLMQEPCIIQRPHGYFPGGLSNIAPCVKASAYVENNLLRESCILGYTRDRKGKVKNYHSNEIANTVHTATGHGGNTDQFVKEPCGCYDNQFGEFAREPVEGLAGTLKADHHNAVITRCRIRKLTPRECFRLMGVDDADIDNIDAYRIRTTLKEGTVKEKPIPKSQKYKMAGNSIVVDVLYYIFHQMFIADLPKPKPVQQSLFD
jgi:C-5 cytosine-specific DNA methylase